MQFAFSHCSSPLRKLLSIHKAAHLNSRMISGSFILILIFLSPSDAHKYSITPPQADSRQLVEALALKIVFISLPSFLIYFSLIKLIAIAIKLSMSPIISSIPSSQLPTERPEPPTERPEPPTEKPVDPPIKGVLTIIADIEFNSTRTEISIGSGECAEVPPVDRHLVNPNGNCFDLFLGEDCSDKSLRIEEGFEDFEISSDFVDAFKSAKLCK